MIWLSVYVEPESSLQVLQWLIGRQLYSSIDLFSGEEKTDIATHHRI
jgi:hypothetical protein